MKQCIKCNNVKPITEYYKYKSNSDKLISRCKICEEDRKRIYRSKNRNKVYISHLKNWLKKRYNITLSQYEFMLKVQRNRCWICKKPGSFKVGECGLQRIMKNKRLAVDHCHLTGKVRGLLCTDCNIAIGAMKDDINILKRVIKYLQIHLEEESLKKFVNATLSESHKDSMSAILSLQT